METFVNDTIQLTIDTDIDVSGYATLAIKYRKPNGTLGRWLASICPGDVNCLTYTTLIGDLDIPGDWLIQGYVEDASEQLNGRWVKFTVYAPLLATCPPWYLKFFAQTGTFTLGNTIYQTVDGVTAFATIDAVSILGSNYGILTLSGISGTFQGNKIIYESALGSELGLNIGFESAGGGDPDFFADWVEDAGNGAIADEGSLVHTGSHAAKLTAGNLYNTFVRTPNINTTVGDHIKLGFYCRADGGGGSPRCRIWDVTGASWITSLIVSGITGTTYTLFETCFTMPAGCSQFRVYLYCIDVVGSIAYFDDITIKQITSAALANGAVY